ncbi:hypothetical protein [Parasphingorhabdus cellanae]|uniref:DUF1304 domain-containing protein n=1 Tax=Parasphingorhabdus cellanae TaxID=2806553 RepID=A0ABX7T787_9SPHN|nr:hypothetical protein [Parasphingorhabdus cellanae]QTD56372.1 hypothetical protein J4G78_01860 [Parasphingorhabdus cellanae]
MSEILLTIAAILALATVLVHSIVGEKRLIGPLVTAGDGVMQEDLAKQVIRFAWHFTSILGLIAVYILAMAAYDFAAADVTLLAVTGSAFLIAGIYDAIVTKVKHIGWPMLAAVGALTLFAIL